MSPLPILPLKHNRHSAPQNPTSEENDDKSPTSETEETESMKPQEIVGNYANPGCMKEQKHHRSDGGESITAGLAKTVAATELEDAAPTLMRASTVINNGNLISAPLSFASMSRLVSCPIVSRISFLLGWTFTIIVVFSCEDYTERLAKLDNVPLTQVEAAQRANLGTNLSCEGRLVYVYNISEAYNREFVRECATFKKGRDLCMYMENWGMGRGFEFGAEQGGPSTQPGLGPGPWHNTWQFALEVYFHERLLRHPCVTEREELANAFFVPYYAGMDLSRRFTHRLAKGELYLELSKWLQGRESWKRHQGRDHFMMLGRIASDFHLLGKHLWGNELLRQEAFNEMVVLSIERTSGSFRKSASIEKEIAIPYPTYFHDSSNAELRILVDWIGQTSQRISLVTIVAGKRQVSTNRRRYRLMTQCGDDPRCTLLLCVGNEASPSLSDETGNISIPVKMEGKTLNVPCNNPPVLLSAMHQSEFCLQPPGDSPTRRSFFDAMLAGCIPVIFHKEAAWSQYVHHLPENGASYSVLIPMTLANNSSVIDILCQVSKSRIREMRANIAKLIPRILYASMDEMRSETSEIPNYAGPSAEIPDAFDIALDAVLGRINSNLKRILNVKL